MNCPICNQPMRIEPGTLQGGDEPHLQAWIPPSWCCDECEYSEAVDVVVREEVKHG